MGHTPRRDILVVLLEHGASQAQIARLFGVVPTAVNMAVRRKGIDLRAARVIHQERLRQVLLRHQNERGRGDSILGMLA